VGVELFILRHAYTLSQLELISCRLPIDPDTKTLISSSRSPSTTLTRGKCGLEPLHWERIWDNFAAELTALVAVNVDEARERIVLMRGRYVVPISVGYVGYREFAVESRDTADTEGLRRFYMTVAARRRQTGYPEVEAATDISVGQWQTMTNYW
jgi:hypothetical protein